jgi:hypothetical protein
MAIKPYLILWRIKKTYKPPRFFVDVEDTWDVFHEYETAEERDRALHVLRNQIFSNNNGMFEFCDEKMSN